MCEADRVQDVIREVELFLQTGPVVVGDDQHAAVVAVKEDGPHVRRVQSHMSGGEGREMEQFRLYVPMAAVDALGWQDAPLRIGAAHDRLVLSRASGAGLEE